VTLVVVEGVGGRGGDGKAGKPLVGAGFLGGKQLGIGALNGLLAFAFPPEVTFAFSI